MDGQAGRRTEGQKDKSDFMGRCRNNVKHPKIKKFIQDFTKD